MLFFGRSAVRSLAVACELNSMGSDGIRRRTAFELMKSRNHRKQRNNPKQNRTKYQKEAVILVPLYLPQVDLEWCLTSCASVVATIEYHKIVKCIESL